MQYYNQLFRYVFYKTLIMKKIDKLNFVKTEAKKAGITAYELGKNTKITSFTAHKVLTGETENPGETTVDAMYEYIQIKAGKKTDKVKEETPKYATKITPGQLSAEDIIANKVLAKLQPYFDNIEAATTAPTKAPFNKANSF